MHTPAHHSLRECFRELGPAKLARITNSKAGPPVLDRPAIDGPKASR